MIVSTSAVVLHVTKYHDTSHIVHLYTEELGRVSCAVKFSRSRKGTLRPQLFQSLMLLEVTLETRASKSIHVMKEARIMVPYTNLLFDPVRGAIAMYLAEFLDKVLRGEGENKPLFAYLLHSFQWLDCATRGVANFHLVFLMRLSLFVGIYPNTEDYHAGDYFDMRASCFVSQMPGHPNYLMPEEAERFSVLMRMRYETMHLFPFDRGQRTYCLELLTDYYRLHMPDFPPLKSMTILQELFS